MRIAGVKIEETVVYQAILKFKIEHCGNSPSLQQLADLVGYSKASIHRAVGKLEEAGKLCYSKDDGGFIIPEGEWKKDE